MDFIVLENWEYDINVNSYTITIGLHNKIKHNVQSLIKVAPGNVLFIVDVNDNEYELKLIGDKNDIRNIDVVNTGAYTYRINIEYLNNNININLYE